MKISGLSTPALVLDVNVLKANMAAMDQLLADSSLKLRPHYKSHKCAAIARWQIERGAIGMTCAKLSEAEDLCDAGIEDILLANQVVDPAKVRKLAELAKNCRLTVCVDDGENVAALSAAAKNCGSTIRCLVEYDIGMERCGVATKEEVLNLAKQIMASDNLIFEGIQAYAGHLSHEEDSVTRREETGKNAEKLRELVGYLRENGIAVNTISGGSTGTSELKAMEGLYTELQAGSYLLMDATYRNLNLPFRNALFLVTTVVSKSEGRVLLDAGVKTCGMDQGMPVPVAGTAREVRANEEHVHLRGYSEDVSVGDRVLLIPGHCCSTVNLHDKIYLVDGERVVDRLLITARGIGR